MRYLKYAVLAAVAAFCMSACKSEYEALLSGNDVDKKYSAAFDYFENGKFLKASQLFESLSFLTSGTPQEDTVQYYWGLCNYRDRDWYTAETNFSQFLQNFPMSPFSGSAEFLRLDCLYKQTLRYELDQTPTYNAIKAISEYMMAHPEDQNISVCNRMMEDLTRRLDKKAFENARIYYTMEDYMAARVAFKNVLKDKAENIYREDILYYTAMSSYKYAQNSVESKKKERFLSFIDDYYNFIGEYPESSHRKELDNCYRKVKNNETSDK